MLEDIKNAIRVVMTPSCWIRNYRTSKEWDRELNHLLDTEDFEIHNFHLRFVKSGTCIWIANYPYAFGDRITPLENFYGYVNKLPARKTVFRLYDKICSGKYKADKV